MTETPDQDDVPADDAPPPDGAPTGGGSAHNATVKVEENE